MPVKQERMKNTATKIVMNRYIAGPCGTPNTALIPPLICIRPAPIELDTPLATAHAQQIWSSVVSQFILRLKVTSTNDWKDSDLR